MSIDGESYHIKAIYLYVKCIHYIVCLKIFIHCFRSVQCSITSYSNIIEQKLIDRWLGVVAWRPRKLMLQQ